ncbi:MAG: serine/threonine-protein kinase, partial [Planctomycetota bacterium]|nr:serine/threonine-protein kinase [Planctomycetota bacterium]
MTPQQENSFGKYILEKKLGQGGMGAVYLALDPSLSRRVALKVMTLKGEEAIERFLREARASAKLKHPNILPLYKIGTLGKQHFFTMDYIEGSSLSDLIEQKSEQLTPVYIAGVMYQIASALSHAHQHGVIHRDIKPGNILIDTRGKPYLMDFGLAKETTRI